MSSSIKVSRTSSSPGKRISIRISIRVRLRIVEIIEQEMSPYFWSWVSPTKSQLSSNIVAVRVSLSYDLSRSNLPPEVKCTPGSDVGVKIKIRLSQQQPLFLKRA